MKSLFVFVIFLFQVHVN